LCVYIEVPVSNKRFSVCKGMRFRRSLVGLFGQNIVKNGQNHPPNLVIIGQKQAPLFGRKR
jgi:hypothetical protein